MEHACLSLETCLSFGFTACAYCDPKTLQLLPEVRDMCRTNRCGKHDTCWSCPPACGSLEQLSGKIRSYDCGVLLQYTGQLEDPFDYEGIMASEAKSKQAFYSLIRRLRKDGLHFLPMGVGACTLCKTCTYPDAPCRHPDLLAPSMEACGIFVSQTCEQFGLKYYYGPNTVTWVSAILFDAPGKSE